MAQPEHPRLTTLPSHTESPSLGPEELARVLHGIKPPNHPNVLADFQPGRHAGIYRLSNDVALVQAVDLLPPMVDDPFSYGSISAAQAMSRIYAVGGRPLTAANFAAFSPQHLPPEVANEILRGAVAKIAETGAVLMGNSVVESSEPLFGLSVIGLVHPERIVTDAGARPDDLLVLTKPLGSGMVGAALRLEACDDETALAATESMAQLNRAAGETMLEIGVPNDIHAAADISSAGLLGHLGAMASGSSVTIELNAAAVPLLPGVEELARDERFLTANTTQTTDVRIEFSGALPDFRRHALADPQISGGLLIAVVPERANDLVHALALRSVTGVVIGRVEEGAPRIVVRA